MRGGRRVRVTLVGVDVFDPASMTSDHRVGVDVSCWMLDTDHDAMVFLASQVFFPRTEAWHALVRSLGADYDTVVWQHPAGATSAPLAAPAADILDEGRVVTRLVDVRERDRQGRAKDVA